jgi:predicted RNase H-like HicB family nuclease
MVSQITRKGVTRMASAATSVAVPERELSVEYEQEADGRWLAEVMDLDGVMAYGTDPQDAVNNAITLAYRVLAEEAEQHNVKPTSIRFKVA